MIIHMNLGPDSYDIVVERGLLAKADRHLNLNRRALIVTDTGVPASYSKTVAGQCKESVIFTVPEVMGNSRINARPRVDFPQPVSPTTP